MTYISCLQLRVFGECTPTCYGLQTQSLSLTEPGLGYLYSAKWSPVRPLLYAVCAESGHLLFYDLKRSKTTPVVKLQASTNKRPLYSMQFNAHKYVTAETLLFVCSRLT